MSAMPVTSAQAQTMPVARPRLYLAGGTALDGDPTPDPSLVITRRGRLAATLSVMTAVVVALLLGLSVMGPASAGTQVVVQPGQTLSEVAAAELPHLSVDQAIVEVQLANRMNTLQVEAGQTLLIP